MSDRHGSEWGGDEYAAACGPTNLNEAIVAFLDLNGGRYSTERFAAASTFSGASSNTDPTVVAPDALTVSESACGGLVVRKGRTIT